MKKIIVLSDTHNNQQTLRTAIKNETELTHIIHLGDNFEDLNNNFDLTEEKELIRVPGLYHPGYKDCTIPIILEIKIEGWNFALAHRLEDLSKSIKPAYIYLYGHTHHSNYDHIENKHFINPGHLKAKTDRGQKASYIVMIIDNNEIEIQYKHLDGKFFRHKHINKL